MWREKKKKKFTCEAGRRHTIGTKVLLAIIFLNQKKKKTKKQVKIAINKGKT